METEMQNSEFRMQAKRGPLEVSAFGILHSEFGSAG
jgi:hypothetical protein